MPSSSSKEFWRPVPSEPGVLASNWGRILLPPRCAAMPNGGYRMYEPQPRYGQLAKEPKRASDKYLHVMLYSEDERRQRPRTVHRMVCEAFHGEPPFPGAVVSHLDEDPTNNRPENLAWTTQRENMNMPKLKAYHRSRTGDHSAHAVGRARRMEEANAQQN